jgi:hypothetical protein
MVKLGGFQERQSWNFTIVCVLVNFKGFFDVAVMYFKQKNLVRFNFETIKTSPEISL